MDEGAANTGKLPQDDPRRRRPDTRLAREMLGWEATTRLREGLEKTVRYFDQSGFAARAPD
ncbi:hypothetical protein [Qipengyuania gaetbuli]|uniref:hypothetical protein n=1 Tax=Qipengyuania gaetbuli TaxID=266952 RepID=UPI001CD7F8C3|nr:hypothetical protein [Qipengyuania gaetbuli]MCA0909216.1 hypothetical protein [Qipengyuania gaetbuli]